MLWFGDWLLFGFVWCGVMCVGLLWALLFAFGCLLFGNLLFVLLVWLAVCCWGCRWALFVVGLLWGLLLGLLYCALGFGLS